MNGREKMLAVDLVPLKPINTSLYLCGSRFQTGPLKELLESASCRYFPLLPQNQRPMAACMRTQVWLRSLTADGAHLKPCWYVFIVMDGNGALFGTLSRNTRTVLHSFSVDLPKKHGRGGQSALRFERLGDEARANYISKASTHLCSHVIMSLKYKSTIAKHILQPSAMQDRKTFCVAEKHLHNYQ